MKRLLALYLAGLGIGGVLWFAKRESSETPLVVPAAKAASDARTASETGTNWASYHKGARVRVSSWDPFRSHHPLFAIDEMAKPTREAKWQSEAFDRSPWIEVLFLKPVDVREIQLDFAGVVEPAKNNLQDYRIHCFDDTGDIPPRETASEPRLIVTGNSKSRAVHPVDCPQTTRLRVAFDVAPLHRNRDRVRLYELRALGEVR